MQIEILKTTEVETDDGFERATQSFEVNEKDFINCKFPCYIVVKGSFSNHFDWSVWEDWYILDEEPEWLQDGHGGNIEEGSWVNNPEEAVDFLTSYENRNYDDGSHNWTEEYIDFKIFTKMFEKRGTIVNIPFHAGLGWCDQYRIEWSKTNTAFTKDEEITLWEKASQDKKLIDFFAQYDIDWSKEAKEQIAYIKQYDNNSEQNINEISKKPKIKKRRRSPQNLMP